MASLPTIEPACATGLAWKDVAPVPAASSQLFQPSLWLEGGAGSQQSIESYVEEHLLKGMSPSIALFALILATLLAFVLWRLLAMCLVNSQSAPSKHKKLPDWKLMSCKAAILACSTAVLAPAIAGMVLLPPHPLSCLQQKSDAAFNDAQSVLDKGEQARVAFQDVKPLLQDIRDLLDETVDPERIKADLQALEPVLMSVPDPQPLLSNFRQLNRIVEPLGEEVQTARAIVDWWQGMVSAAQSAADLSWLEREVAPSISSYVDTLEDLPQPNTVGPGRAPAVYEELRAAQSGISWDRWQRKIQSLSSGFADMQNFAGSSPPELSISNNFGGLAEVAQGARSTLQPMITVLTAVNGIDAQAAAATLSSLNSTLNDINKDIAEIKDGDELAQELSSATDLVGHLADMQRKQNLTELDSTTNSKASSTFKELSTVHLQSVLVNMDNLLESLLQRGKIEDALREARNAVLKIANSSAFTKAEEQLADLSETFSDFNARAAAIELMLAGSKSKSGSELAGEYPRLFRAARSTLPVAKDALNAASTLSPALVAIQDAAAAQPSVALFQELQREVLALAQQLEGYPTKDEQQDWVEALKEAVDAFNRLPDNRMEVLEQPRSQLVSTLQSAHSAIDEVEAEIDRGLQKHGKKLDDAEDELPEAVSARDEAVSTVEKHWRAAYQAWQGGYGLLILLLIIQAVVACFGPRGLATSAVLLQAWLVIWLLLAALVLGAMVFMNDACKHAERILLEQVEDRTELSFVPRYYLLGGNTGNEEVRSLKEALKLDGVLDLDKVQAEIDQSQKDLMTDLEQDIMLKQDLRSAIAAANGAVDDAQEQLSGVAEAAEREHVLALYKSLKACVCCTMGAQLFEQWLCVTISGLLAYLSVLTAALEVGRLGNLHSKGSDGQEKRAKQEQQEAPLASPYLTRPPSSAWNNKQLVPRKNSSHGSSASSASYGSSTSSAPPFHGYEHSILMPAQLPPVPKSSSRF